MNETYFIVHSLTTSGMLNLGKVPEHPGTWGESQHSGCLGTKQRAASIAAVVLV